MCPSSFEFKALDKRKLSRAGALLVCSGMGKLRALYACATLRQRHPRLRAIALIGFAGALTPNLKIGDVVEPVTFVEQDYHAEPFEPFPHIIKKGRRRFFRESVNDVTMLTQDRFLKENPYRGSLYEKRFKKIACDMESYAVAYYCRSTKIPYVVAKIISDCADGSADHDFLKACRELSPKLNALALELVHASF